ncbi:hypothetical protein [Gymnodinialimonas ulvae]|uniref:hypothetical protein n=1 Tax=Gymnodinialimonas ulvae TaxID=3126504 RepID=UPI0030B11CD1
MAQDQPKPLLVRLLLFVIGGGCGLAIVTMAIFIPFGMVADWSGGGRGQSVGWYEVLVGLSILAAGFGVPVFVFARETLSRTWSIVLWIVLTCGFLWVVLAPDKDIASYVAVVVVAALLGTGFFFAFRALSGRAPPPEWKDAP